MVDMVVSTSFRAQDRVTKSFGRMSKGADKFGRKASKAFKKASMAGSGFGKITKGILAAGAIQRGLGLVEQGLGSVVSQFIEFDQAATMASVKFSDVTSGAKSFEQALKETKAAARDAGATTEFTAAQSAKAIAFLAQANFNSAESFGALSSMINLATSTGEDFATVADFSSDLLGAMGLAVNDTAQKIKNLNRLNDVLVKTANSANVTVEDMFETMKIAGPIADEYGTSLEDVAAMTAIMGNAGIKGSQGATTLKNIFTRLAAPTKQVTEALGKLGLTQDDLIDKNGKFKNISKSMGLIGRKLKDLPQAEKLGVLSGILGKFALAGGAKIIKMVEAVEDFNKSLLDSQGINEKTAEIMRKTLLNRLKALGSAATEAGFKFLSAFDKKGKDAITRLTKVVREFNVDPIIRSVKIVFNSLKSLAKEVLSLSEIWATSTNKINDSTGKVNVSTIERFALAFQSTVNAIKPLLPILPAVAAGFIAYQAVMKIAAFLQFIAVIKAASVSVGLFNAVLAVNPIGLFIAGLTALAAVGFLIVKNWDSIVSAINSSIDLIGGVLATAGQFWGDIFFNVGQKIGGAFFSMGEVIKNVFSSVGEFVGNIFSNIGDTVGKNLLKVGDKIKGFFGFNDNISVGSKIPNQQNVLGGSKTEQSPGRSIVQAPNKTEVEARQKIGISGKIQVAGLPKESTGELKTPRGSSINMEMLGANP